MSKKLLANVGNTVVDNYRRYYQEYEGTFITATNKSEDDTLDTSRYIEVTEIWGNTVQDENNLEDIQSVGELYVDDEENPILDDLGREQYKIEIESCNNTNIIKDDNIVYEKYLNLSNGREETTYDDWHTKDFIKINPNLTYYYSFIKLDTTVNIRAWVDIFTYDINKNFLGTFRLYSSSNTFTLNKDVQFVKFNNGGISGDKSKFKLVVSRTNSDLLYNANSQSNKTTILLPCQLQKVGNVYDRLYWDSEKGKYVVEKNDTQLIETNITEKIQLPCYSEKTHIFVNNTLDTTMKVLVPYKGKELSPVRYGLICWLDGRDGNNGDTVWKDKSGNGNDAKLQGFLNNGTDGFVNGKIVTKVPCNISMNKIDASEITIFVSYKLYNLNQLQGNFAPRIFRFGTLAYDLYISKTSGYGLYSISKNYVSNIIPTLNTVLTNTLTVDSLGNATLYKDNELIIKENKLIDLNDLSYLLLICDSGGFNGELYSVLIYNRALTEEEIQQNYLYEQSIKRGE